MALERRDPIPLGRYWVAAVDTAAIFAFDMWLRRNDQTVALVKKEEHEGTSGFGLEPGALLWDPSTWKWGAVGHAKWHWYLFDVIAPTKRWDGGIKGLGAYPNVVRSSTAPNAPQVSTAADTVQRPAPVTATDWLGDVFSDAKTWLVIAGLIYLATRDGRR